MGKVVLAGNRVGGELQAAQEREARLELLEFVAIADIPYVAQDIGTRVDVRVVAHRCRDAPVVAAEMSKLSSGSPARRRRSASRRSASEAFPRIQRSASSRTGPVAQGPPGATIRRRLRRSERDRSRHQFYRGTADPLSDFVRGCDKPHELALESHSSALSDIVAYPPAPLSGAGRIYVSSQVRRPTGPSRRACRFRARRAADARLRGGRRRLARPARDPGRSPRAAPPPSSPPATASGRWGSVAATTLGRVWLMATAVLLAGLAEREAGLAAALLLARPLHRLLRRPGPRPPLRARAARASATDREVEAR